MQQGIHNGLQMFIKNTYTPVLEWALKNRATTISIAISTFILSLGIVASGFLKFNFFPPLEADIVIATVQYPEGTPVSITKEGLERIEESAFKLKDSLEESYP